MARRNVTSIGICERARTSALPAVFKPSGVEHFDAISAGDLAGMPMRRFSDMSTVASAVGYRPNSNRAPFSADSR
jgi:hypothetical protein